MSAGKEIKGKVTVTISRGRLVWYEGKLDVQPGTGRFIKLPTHGYLFDGLDNEGEDTAERLIKSFAAANGRIPVQREVQSGAAAAAAAGKEASDRQEL